MSAILIIARIILGACLLSAGSAHFAKLEMMRSEEHTSELQSH